MKKLYFKYKELPNELKVSFWFMFSSVFQNGIMFIVTPVFTRMMTTDQYGQITVYNSWYSIISILATLNFSYGVYNNAMVKYPNNRDQYTSSIQMLSFICTGVMFLLYLVFKEYINSFTNLSTTLTILMFLQIMFMPAIGFFSTRERFENRYILMIFVTISMSLLNPVLGVIAVKYSEHKVIARVISIVIVQMIFGIVIAGIQFYRGKKYFDKEYWKFALMFNIPLIPHYLSQVILGSSDRILIAAFWGEDKAAIYGIAYTVSMLMTIVSSSINATFIPWTYKKLKSEEYEELNKKSIILVFLVATMILLAIMVAPEIVSILAPKEYMEAIWIIPPVSLSVLYIFVYGLFANIEFYYEKNIYVLVASLFAGILSVGLNFILIPKFGYLIAGYTTLISYILLVVLHYIFMEVIRKKKNITTKFYDVRKIILILFITSSIAALFLVVYKYNIIRYSLIFLVLVLSIVFYKKIYNIIKKILGLSKEDL